MGLFRKRQEEVLESVPPLVDRLLEHHNYLRLSSSVVDSDALAKDLLDAVRVLTLVGESEDRAVQCIREIRRILGINRNATYREKEAAWREIDAVVRVAGRLHDDIP